MKKIVAEIRKPGHANRTLIPETKSGRCGITSAKVNGLFVTRNRLIAVRVKGAALVTTETQPIALVSGGFKGGVELKAGDRIWRWTGSERQAVTVLGVSPAGEAKVFNLVFGGLKTFIVEDFLVRSKPPAGEVVNRPAQAVGPKSGESR